jgi:hypothetical protein
MWTLRQQSPACFLLCTLLLVSACSSSSSSTTDARLSADIRPVDSAADSTVDVAPELDSKAVDRGPVYRDVGSVTDSGLPSACTGNCAVQSVTATFGQVSEPLERAVYGVDRDKQGNPGTYIEALHGGFAGCPEQSSPTPERTLIISGLPLPRSGPALTLSDGLVVSLLDYKGTLLAGSPVAKATSASVTFRAANVCPSCVGKPAPSDPNGFVALEIDATFPDSGRVSGYLYAVHCDSLDL